MLLITISVRDAALPHQFRDIDSGQDQLLGIGGAALFAGLLLLGLRHPIWKLFEGVVSERAKLRFPTAFGARSDEYRELGKERWAVDPGTAWPLLAPLMAPEERDLHVDLETDARLFLNGALGALGISAYWLVELLCTKHQLRALVFLVPLPIFYVLYRAAVMAADRWYEQKLATVALHRRELYTSVGIDATDERAAGELASELVRLRRRAGSDG